MTGREAYLIVAGFLLHRSCAAMQLHFLLGERAGVDTDDVDYGNADFERSAT
jgi:hypothetical protein